MMNTLFEQQEMTKGQLRRHHLPLHLEESRGCEESVTRSSRCPIDAATSRVSRGCYFSDDNTLSVADGHIIFSSQRKSARRRKHRTENRSKHSFFASVSYSPSVLGALGYSLLVLPLWMHWRDNDFFTLFPDEASAPASFALPLMTSVGLCCLFTADVSSFSPSVAPLTAKVVRWYGLTIVTALHVGQVSEAATRVLLVSASIICWILGGWHAFELKQHQAARQKQKRLLQPHIDALTTSLQDTIIAVSRASLFLSLPVAMVSLGLPRVLSHWVTTATMYPYEGILWLPLDEYPGGHLVFFIRIFGVNQLAMAAMILQWRDDMLAQGLYSGTEKKSMMYLPLAQLLLTALPTYGLGAMMSFGKDVSIQVGYGIMFMAVAGTSVWTGVRMVMA